MPQKGTFSEWLLWTVLCYVLLSPFLPETSEKIFSQLNTNVISYESIDSFNGLVAGTKLNDPEPIFVRLDKEKVLEEINKGEEK